VLLHSVTDESSSSQRGSHEEEDAVPGTVHARWEDQKTVIVVTGFGLLRIEPIFELFSGFPEGQFLLRNMHFLAGLGVPPHIRLILFHDHVAETPDLDAIAALEVFGHGVEEDVGNLLGLKWVQIELGFDGLREF